MADWGTPADTAAAAVGDQANGTQANGTDVNNPATADGEKKTIEGWVAAEALDYDKYNAPNGADYSWEGNNMVYEWDGDEGDIGPEYPELEVELFGPPEARGEFSHGIDFSIIQQIDVGQVGPKQIKPVMKFSEAGLHPAMLRNIELSGYDVPTPIQMFTIPAIHEGFDIIGIAQTGSGKTGAYLIPIINKLMGKAKQLSAPRPNPMTYDPRRDGQIRAEPLVVVVCPSRELAIQIFNEARKFCYRSMLRPCVVYGGGPIGLQIQQLSRGCDILIASPGRLIDFMERPDVLTLRRVRYMVLDEADEMLHDDWSEEFEKIVSGGEQEEGNIHYSLFSATFPKKVRDLAKNHLSEEHVRLSVGRAGSTHRNIKQDVIHTTYASKRTALIHLLQSLPPARTIIFVNSKAACDELDDFLYSYKLPCTSMHSSRTQKEREDAMRAFRRGDSPILITTSVASRGIDVRNVMHVINYDLPSMDYGGIEDYTHRIGRTGRIGHRGLATSFYTDKDEPIASVLTRTLLETNQNIPEFLKQYIPEGWEHEEGAAGVEGAEGQGRVLPRTEEDLAKERKKLTFEADSDWEDEDDVGGDAGGGDAWGGGDDNAGGADAWGGGGGGDAGGDAGGASAWGNLGDADNKASESKPAEDAWGSGGGGGW